MQRSWKLPWIIAKGSACFGSFTSLMEKPCAHIPPSMASRVCRNSFVFASRCSELVTEGSGPER